jgi:predicted RND superfamily exporter protein
MTGDRLSAKPLEGLVGLFSSTLSTVTAAGFMFICGVPFISQVCVAPFIALAIGIDDTYIILSAWSQSDRRASTADRMAATVREAGVACTVTTLTDCLSFAIGACSTTPAISIFCLYMAVMVAVDFIYQFTFFLAIITFSGDAEHDGSHYALKWRRLDEKYIQHARKKAISASVIDKWFERVYAPVICARWFRVITLAMYAVYIAAAVYGCSIMR